MPQPTLCASKATTTHNKTDRVEDGRNGEDTKTDLGLENEDHGTPLRDTTEVGSVLGLDEDIVDGTSRDVDTMGLGVGDGSREACLGGRLLAELLIDNGLGLALGRSLGGAGSGLASTPTRGHGWWGWWEGREEREVGDVLFLESREEGRRAEGVGKSRRWWATKKG